MKKPDRPGNEEARIASLRGLDVLDTPAEERFDRLTRLARRIFDVPIALVSLVDADRQWFKSRSGLDARETPRDISFCGHAILCDEALVVCDTHKDARFHDNPLVVEDPSIRFYAGFPLSDSKGHRLGTLCLIDQKPRRFDDEDVQSLKDLADAARSELLALDMATIDALTGLANRRGFKIVADKAVAVCDRFDGESNLLFFDLDKFKDINDELGHATGDRALVEMADLLREVFRDSDVIARLGGDEFAVLLTGTNVLGAEVAISRLDAKLAARNAESDHALNYSAGRVAFDPKRHRCIEDLIAEADEQMYEAKGTRF